MKNSLNNAEEAVARPPRHDWDDSGYTDRTMGEKKELHTEEFA